MSIAVSWMMRSNDFCNHRNAIMMPCIATGAMARCARNAGYFSQKLFVWEVSQESSSSITWTLDGRKQLALVVLCHPEAWSNWSVQKFWEKELTSRAMLANVWIFFLWCVFLHCSVWMNVKLCNPISNPWLHCGEWHHTFYMQRTTSKKYAAYSDCNPNTWNFLYSATGPAKFVQSITLLDISNSRLSRVVCS